MVQYQFPIMFFYVKLKQFACNEGDLGWIPGWEDLLEKGMATHSSILACRIPWTEEPSRLQSMGLQRVRHDWSNWACRAPQRWDCLLSNKKIKDFQVSKNKSKRIKTSIRFYVFSNSGVIAYSKVPLYHRLLTLVGSEQSFEKGLHSPFLCSRMLCMWHLILFCAVKL